MRVKGQVLGGAFLVVSLLTPAMAQGPGGPSGPGGGGFQPSPEMQKFQQQHQYHRKLQTMVGRGLQELEKDKSTKVTAAQAKQLSTILKPWQAKPKMTQEEAKTLLKSVQKVFTPKQLTVLGKLPDRGFGGGGRRAGSGSPGGPGGGGPRAGGVNGSPSGPRAGGGGGGGGRNFNLAAMKNYNPFSTKADPNNPMSSRRVASNKWLFSALSARAANKPLPPRPQQGGPVAQR